MLTNSDSVEEMQDDEDTDIEGEVLNPEFIGASKALETGDLEKYAAIVSGHQIVEIAELMKKEEELAANSDSEIEFELKKFDDKAYKEHPERLAESQTLDRMVKFDKTFKMVMDHVRKQLNISHLDLNRHIETSIMGTKSEPSPMLKYYNELLQNTNFILPNKHRLEIDQKVFRKIINKVVLAHKKELDWVRNLAVHESKKHIQKRFEQTSQILEDECNSLLSQF